MAEKKENKVKSDNLLEETLKNIQKQFGEGSVMKLGDRDAINIDTLPSGS
jgi:recombination protein RecA